jgi:hypothetical protein
MRIKNSYQGTADYTDETDGADEEKQHQRRTEGSQSVYIRAICGKRTVVWEPLITRMNRIAQMSRNDISVEPKVRNLCTSVFISGKKTVARGTADYADEHDSTDE